jgi:DNA-binding Lrp family transcriptional regulator
LRKCRAGVAKFWHKHLVVDRFDLKLLNLLQRNASRTADSLSCDVPLSPSAIARRLRRLHSQGLIAGTIALLGAAVTESRLRAFTFIQLGEHADLAGKAALVKRLNEAAQVQFCYETTGEHDLLALFDCANLAEFNDLCDALLTTDSTVRRYETSFVKRQMKFAPYVELAGGP